MLLDEGSSKDRIYRLYSYETLVLEIVNGKITIDGRSKIRFNYDGRCSPTTSKHITQALDFLGMRNYY